MLLVFREAGNMDRLLVALHLPKDQPTPDIEHLPMPKIT